MNNAAFKQKKQNGKSIFKMESERSRERAFNKNHRHSQFQITAYATYTLPANKKSGRFVGNFLENIISGCIDCGVGATNKLFSSRTPQIINQVCYLTQLATRSVDGV